MSSLHEWIHERSSVLWVGVELESMSLTVCKESVLGTRIDFWAAYIFTLTSLDKFLKVVREVVRVECIPDHQI